MKKISLMLAVMSLLVMGCSSGSKESQEKEGQKIEVQNDKSLKVGWKDVIPNIERDTELKVSMIDTADVTAYTTNIKQSLSSSTPPDLFTWWSGTQLKDLVDNDLLADVTDEWSQFVDLGISDSLKDALTVDGKIYGAPLYVIYNGVVYNKNIFEELGLNEPETLEEFMELCEVIKESGVTPIGIGSTWQSFVWPMALMGSLNPDLYDQWVSGEVSFNDPQIKEIFYAWAEMIEKGYFSEQQQDQGKDLGMKEVAMVYNANNWTQGLEDDYDMEIGKDVDIFVLPGTTKEDKRTIFYEIAPFLISKNGDKDKAVEVLKNYYSKENQEVYSKQTGASAITDITVENKATDKMLSYANDEEQYGLKLRYYEYFTPEVVNLSIDEYWRIASNPTKEQVDQSLETIQKLWEQSK